MNKIYQFITQGIIPADAGSTQCFITGWAFGGGSSPRMRGAPSTHHMTTR